MLELQKGLFIENYNQVTDNDKGLMYYVTLLDHAKNRTIDNNLINNINSLKEKFLGNYSLTEKDILVLKDIEYLNYLNSYFPYSFNSYDKIMKEYDFLFKVVS